MNRRGFLSRLIGLGAAMVMPWRRRIGIDPADGRDVTATICHYSFVAPFSGLIHGGVRLEYGDDKGKPTGKEVERHSNGHYVILSNQRYVQIFDPPVNRIEVPDDYGIKESSS